MRAADGVSLYVCVCCVCLLHRYAGGGADTDAMLTTGLRDLYRELESRHDAVHPYIFLQVWRLVRKGREGLRTHTLTD